VHKENDAIFVGTDLGVYLKTDKSNDWILYSNNLPNTIVNDLKINYTANTLWAATYGRGLWSTIMQFSSDT
jgi:xyloglucan-specific exo-beta-1,4-glucanase